MRYGEERRGVQSADMKVDTRYNSRNYAGAYYGVGDTREENRKRVGTAGQTSQSRVCAGREKKEKLRTKWRKSLLIIDFVWLFFSSSLFPLLSLSLSLSQVLEIETRIISSCLVLKILLLTHRKMRVIQIASSFYCWDHFLIPIQQDFFNQCAAKDLQICPNRDNFREGKKN